MRSTPGRANDAGPWAKAVSRILAFAYGRGAQVIGVTGDRPRVGVSTLCNELEQAYARRGVETLLIDASRANISEAQKSAMANDAFDLRAAASRSSSGFARINLAEYVDSLPADRQKIRSLLEAVSASGAVIIVDLPPVLAPDPDSARAFSLIGSVCDLVFLTCLSGSITGSELTECTETCKIAGVPIGGIIVNDWKEPGAKIAVGW